MSQLRKAWSWTRSFSYPDLDLVNLNVMLLLLLLLNYIISLASSSKHAQTPYLLDPRKSDAFEDNWYKLPGVFKDRECFAVQTSALIRNGISNPPKKLISNINSIHHHLVEAMDLEVNQKLYDWNNPFAGNEIKSESISEKGKIEQYSLGKQIAAKLLSFFGSEDVGDVTFLSSSKTASEESSQQFYSGFFDGVHGSDYTEEAHEFYATDVDDKLLRFFNRCSVPKKKIDSVKNDSEFLKFLTSEHILTIRKKIINILGLQKYILTNGNLKNILPFCKITCSYISPIIIVLFLPIHPYISSFYHIYHHK